MRHHRHAVGWKEANKMTRRAFVLEIVGLIAVFAGVIGLMVIAVDQLAR